VMVSCADNLMEAFAISTGVNGPGRDAPATVEPLASGCAPGADGGRGDAARGVAQS